MRYWAAWQYVRFGTTLRSPPTTEVILQFIEDHHSLPLSLGSLEGTLPPWINCLLVNNGFKKRSRPFQTRQISNSLLALRTYLKLMGWPEIDQIKLVQCFDAISERTTRLKRRDRLGLSVDPDERRILLSSCDASPTGLRDRALILLVAVERSYEDQRALLATHTSGLVKADGTYFWSYQRNKTMRGRLHYKPPMQITGDVANALNAWLKCVNLKTGHVFCQIAGHKILPKPLSLPSFDEMLRRRRELCGLPSFRWP
ncbi:hypothetical protein LMG3441_00654 [Achromobacter kerstersii]|uniref:Tyr recombinase domain-containing protein n=1 Tax=Achromobacter kerstersii TaxID=1353890 RepID=A0A6S6ZDU1_9BURK|nr:hypothetical protein LMG3441_00654 [Achromobacter kerstersii]